MRVKCVLGICFILLSLFSCSKTVTQNSFAAALDEVDALIIIQKPEAAVKKLKSLEKRAISGSNFLSIAKRYMQLKELPHTEKLLANALKKNPGNAEITALYAAVLLRQVKPDQALIISKNLQTTRYGSIYTEALMHSYRAANRPMTDAEFAVSFEDAWIVTQNKQFLNNAAVLTAINTNTADAYRFHPENMEHETNPFFWARISYDSSNFVQAYDDALIASEVSHATEENQVEALLLAADAGLQMDKQDMSQTIWETMMYYYPSQSPIPYYNTFVLLSETDPAIQIREAQIAKLSAVTGLVKNFPDDLISLTAYAQFALETNQKRKESNIQQELRSKGFRTIEMEYADSLPRIPISDALYRFEQALEKSTNDRIFLEYTKFKWKTEEKKIIDADVWSLLEKYPDSSAIAEYVVWYFMYRNRPGEAQELLQKWEAKGNQEWTAEYSALSKALNGDTSDAEAILESFANNTQAAQRAVSNLAYIKEVKKDYANALDMYSIAAGRTINKKEKAELHYRIGRIYITLHDLDRAKMSLMYSLTLNPEHNSSQLLLKKIQ